MEQFMKLPPGQKAAVLAAILAVLGIGMYFLLVDPELARGDIARKDLIKAERELATLRADSTPEEQERLRKAKDDLTELDKENRKMLPPAEEVPDFIESVQKDAHDVGMRVVRFDRLPDESYDLYNASPIRMAVQGTMKELIQFLRVYAGPERRVINIRDLGIEKVSPDQQVLKDAVKARKPLEETGKQQLAVTKTPEQVLLDSIEIAEEARKQSQVRATFTAFAFTWTGKPALKVEGAPPPVKKKKKRT